MKVLFMFGGLTHYYNRVLNRLNDVTGLEIVVVVPRGRGESIGTGVYQTQEGVRFQIIPLEEYRAFYGKHFFRDFRRVVVMERPDVVVTCWPYVLGWLVRPGLRRTLRHYGIKVFMKEIPFQVPKFREGVRGQIPGGKYSESESKSPAVGWRRRVREMVLTWLRRVYYGYMDGHVNYIEDAYEILGSYGVPRRKVFITYNSPDTEEIFAARREVERGAPLFDDDRPLLLHVGRLVHWKRVDLLIEAFARLRPDYPDLELIVVGDGPEGTTLRRQVEAAGLSEAVRFVGAVYDPVELGRYYAAASVYVLAGMGGLSINEAMCYAKPVVCSVCDGTEKKLVCPGENGYFFREGDAGDLARRLKLLLADPARRREMGERSERIIREEVNIHTVIRGLLRAFNTVARPSAPLTYTPE